MKTHMIVIATIDKETQKSELSVNCKNNEEVFETFKNLKNNFTIDSHFLTFDNVLKLKVSIYSDIKSMESFSSPLFSFLFDGNKYQKKDGTFDIEKINKQFKEKISFELDSICYYDFGEDNE